MTKDKRTRPTKHIELPDTEHDKLQDFQEVIRLETGRRPWQRECVGLLLDREAMYRARLTRLGKLEVEE